MATHEDNLRENESSMHKDEAEDGCYEAEAENFGLGATLASRT